MPGITRFRAPSSTELIYLETSTQVVSRSSVAGRVTHAQFNAALIALERHFAILRACVHDKHFVERPRDAATVAAWLSPAAVTPEGLCGTLLDRQLDVSERLYEVHVVAGEDALDIILLTSHSVTDATALVEIHSCLIHFCDCAARGIDHAMPQQAFPDTIDAAVDRRSVQLGLANPPTSDAPAYTGDFLRLPTQPRTEFASPPRHLMERLEIEADLVHSVADASHAQDVSVHAVLTAAFVLAIRDLSESSARQMLIRASIDMRRRLEPHVSADLVCTAVTAHISHVRDTSGDIFAVARAIFDDVRSGTADGRIFDDYTRYPTLFGIPQDAPVALNISDMGVVHFRWPLTALRVTGFEYATGMLKTYPNTSVTIVGGKLVALTAYRPEITAPATLQRLSRLVRSHLQRACGTADIARPASSPHGLVEGGLTKTAAT